MALVVSASVADVTAASEKLVADEALVSDSLRLVGDPEALLDARTRLMSALVRRLRAAYEADATAIEWGRSTKSWLIEDMHLSPREAADLMLLVRLLDSFPATEAALAATEINPEHAVRIVRGLMSLPPDWRPTIEPHLLECARDHPPAELKGFIHDLLERLGLLEDKEAAEQAKLASRGFCLSSTLDGARAVSGELTADGAAIVTEALRVFDSGDSAEDERTTAQRDHDSLVGICREFLAHQDQLPSFAGSPVGVIVTVPLETLERRLAQVDATLLPLGARIGPETARRLACDAQLIPTVLGMRSEVLDIGRAGRDFTEAMRRAQYLEQHGSCAFPHCRRRVVDCHHIVWWTNGGATAQPNAAWLCAFHHWLVHEGGWTLRKNPDRSLTFTNHRGEEHTRHLSAA